MYDLQSDPDEMKNIYGDPAYKDVQANLHKKLDKLRVKYGDSDNLTKKFLDDFLEAGKK
jgi:hypothetical protein